MMENNNNWSIGGGTATAIYNGCYHNVQVQQVGDFMVSVCTICGEILDQKKADKEVKTAPAEWIYVPVPIYPWYEQTPWWSNPPTGTTPPVADGWFLWSDGSFRFGEEPQKLSGLTDGTTANPLDYTFTTTTAGTFDEEWLKMNTTLDALPDVISVPSVFGTEPVDGPKFMAEMKEKYGGDEAALETKKDQVKKTLVSDENFHVGNRKEEQEYEEEQKNKPKINLNEIGLFTIKNKDTGRIYSHMYKGEDVSHIINRLAGKALSEEALILELTNELHTITGFDFNDIKGFVALIKKQREALVKFQNGESDF